MTLEMKMDLMMDLKYEEGEIKGKIDSILELLSDYSSDIEKYKDALQEMCKDNENSEKNLNILLKKAARIENIAEFDEALEMLK